MNPPDRKVVEAILLLSDEPVAARLIGEVLEKPQAEVQTLLEDLAAAYDTDNRGFVLREVADGWRLYTSPECAPWLERFVGGHRPGRLTAAALEVLAIVAYRQPLSRSEIAEIRGVDSDRALKTLVQRGLVVEAGRASGAGSPALFEVSVEFLERMGLRSVDELPPLAGFVPDADVVEDLEAKLSPGA